MTNKSKKHWSEGPSRIASRREGQKFLNNLIKDCSPYQKNIYLSCVVGVEYDNDILPHFIRHYIELGIAPEDFLITLHSHIEDSPNLENAKKILKKYNIKEKSIWVGIFNRKCRITDREKVVTDNTNPDDWVVSCDVDELHEYAVDLRKLVTACNENGYNHAKGIWRYRLTEDGKIPNDLPDNCNIWKLFPKEVKRLNHRDCGRRKKILLHKANIFLHSGLHCITNLDIESQNPVPITFIVFHFKFRGNIIEKLKLRKKNYKKLGYPWWRNANFSLIQYTENGTFL